MKKKAFITGVTGQDGSYLSELLLEKDYEVFGLKRRSSTDNLWRLKDCLNNPNFHLVEGDITDPSLIISTISKIKPDEIYNLAAQSHVGSSFDQANYTFQVDAIGLLNILEAVRMMENRVKIYHAGSSEEFGSNYSWSDICMHTGKEEIYNCNSGKIQPFLFPFQYEKTEMSGNSPYAVAKIAARNLCNLYVKSYNMFVSPAILMNHESPRRGEHFVTRKITKWIGDFLRWKYAKPKLVVEEEKEDCLVKQIDENGVVFSKEYFPKLRLGNIKAKRDWGHAKDYVRAIHLILQQKEPDTFLISTGIAYSVEDFLKEAFDLVNLDWKEHVVIDKNLFRPCEVPYLRGNSNKAHNVLGWKPRISFKELVKEMVESDCNEKF